MTELLTKILESVRTWPPERQDEAAELLVRLAERDEAPIKLTCELRELLEASKAATRRGDLATDEEVEAAYRRFRG